MASAGIMLQAASCSTEIPIQQEAMASRLLLRLQHIPKSMGFQYRRSIPNISLPIKGPRNRPPPLHLQHIPKSMEFQCHNSTTIISLPIKANQSRPLPRRPRPHLILKLMGCQYRHRGADDTAFWTECEYQNAGGGCSCGKNATSR